MKRLLQWMGIYAYSEVEPHETADKMWSLGEQTYMSCTQPSWKRSRTSGGKYGRVIWIRCSEQFSQTTRFEIESPSEILVIITTQRPGTTDRKNKRSDRSATLHRLV